MQIGIPKEIGQHEKRVALVPESVKKLISNNIKVLIESKAGTDSNFSDIDYEKAGAQISESSAKVYSESDLIVKIEKPTSNEVALIKDGAILLALLQPTTNIELIKQLKDTGVTSFSLDAIPRIARAQRMDVLSSQSSIAGYKAAIIAADNLSVHFPMMMTAAGTMPPARGLVVGAGVAGLQAIATGRRLGALMYAYDVRPAVKEQVESLGATFIDESTAERDNTETSGGYARAQSEEEQNQTQALLESAVKNSNFVITTAQIPGKPAPTLITKAMVEAMKPGSVIVDLAAESGGNCEITLLDQIVIHSEVKILGPANLPSTMPQHASQMYSRNVASFIDLIIDKDNSDPVILDLEDSIINESLITHKNEVLHSATLETINNA
tara:strand:- start:756 stop:1904 length:1149 start_codon:yes stop_codon:yes gene_type:complete